MFQAQFGLTQNGDADPPTIRKLEEIHDRVSSFPEEPAVEESGAEEDSDAVEETGGEGSGEN